MAAVELTHQFVGSVAKVFAAIRQYEKYPKYLPGVSKIEVKEGKAPDAVCLVRYELNIIKTFFYELNMFEKSPNRLWWTLHESNLMTMNSGSWDFSAHSPKTTDAIYRLEVKFKGLVPSAVTDKIAKANLPIMMAGFQKLVEDSEHV